MDIAWLGHSCLRLRDNQVTLITDPFSSSVGLTLAPQRADIVTSSNDHPHHSSYDSITGQPKVLSLPGEYEVAGIYIVGMGTRCGEGEPGKPRQINTVFTVRMGGLTLCHLGDLGQVPPPGQLESLNQADVLFVPAGGTCTISAAKAAELANLIAPRIVVPVHYRTDGVKVKLDALDGFLREMGVSGLTPQPRLSVTAASLPSELRVVILQPEA